jgi:predicted nucleic acid-binding Zn ribbon protein
MKAILELFAFMKQRRKFILWPVIIVLILLGIVLVFAANSAVAPFIYTLF